MDKNIYINDLIHRYSGHTFTEVVTNDLTKVTFKNAGSVVIREKVKMDAIDAYHAIRRSLLASEDPDFLSTTTERDALTNVDRGTAIFNITTLRDESYDGTNWIGAAGAGLMAPFAYGSMFEDSSGSNHNTTTKAWITAGVGKVDGNGIITFADNAAGDRLVVGTGGAGDYRIGFHVSSTNAGGNSTFAAINVNAVEQVSIKAHHAGDSAQERLLASEGYLPLAENDYITLELISSSPSDIVSIHTCSVLMERLS